jgi:hypothetical protein
MGSLRSCDLLDDQGLKKRKKKVYSISQLWNQNLVKQMGIIHVKM